MEKNVSILVYGVRPSEVEFFNNLNSDFNYELILLEDFTITDENIQQAKGCTAIMVRESINLGRHHLEMLKEFGVKHILTRTAGFDHLDLEAIKELGFESAQRVPKYSPNAIGELALGFALTLSRKIQLSTMNCSEGSYEIEDVMLSKEIRKSTVGILGTGNIGLTTATLFKGVGAKIIGYDPYENPNAKGIIEYHSFEEVIKTADIISIHLPLMDSTKHLINKEVLNQMKDDVVLINTSRGKIVSIKDVIDWLKNNPKATFGADVLEGEEEIFFKKHNLNDCDPLLKDINELYPRILITPHVGAVTTEALSNTIKTSFENLDKVLKGETLENSII